jgi:hypothetical protein
MQFGDDDNIMTAPVHQAPSWLIYSLEEQTRKKIHSPSFGSRNFPHEEQMAKDRKCIRICSMARANENSNDKHKTLKTSATGTHFGGLA